VQTDSIVEIVNAVLWPHGQIDSRGVVSDDSRDFSRVH